MKRYSINIIGIHNFSDYMLNKDEFVKVTEDAIIEYNLETEEEQSLIKALRTYDALTKTINNHFEIIQEWFGIQNSQKYKEIKDNYKFIRYLIDTDLTLLEKNTYLSKSLGKESLKLIEEFANINFKMYSLKSKAENYINNITKEKYPNLHSILGPIMTIRFLDLGRGLKNLSKMPSSTLQLLGAENALFRHLKYGKKSPKYGLLYQHAIMSGINDHKKGQLARYIAGKIFLASKLDYSKKELNNSLLKEIEKKKEGLKSRK
jgi:nucleolar protein 56